MDKLNLINYAAKFSYKQLQIKTQQQNSGGQQFVPSETSAKPATPTASNTAQSVNTPQLGTFAGNETSVYVKDLMNLPKNLNEFVYMLQRGYSASQMNKFLLEQYTMRRPNLTSEKAQILAQLQGMNTEELQIALKTQLATLNSANSLKNLEILSQTKINMSALAELLQTGGKDAIAKIIVTMANASQQGVKDLSQLKDTAKLINASVALSAQDNSAQTLKSVLLLYLPWLPLQEGTDFEIEIQQNNDENNGSESILVITITTVNFGKVIATLILETSNSVLVNIECSEKFPKNELMTRIQTEQKHYSMQSVLNFQNLEARSEDTTRTKAAVTMSSMDEVNPYLLLMSHTIIKHTIEIDNISQK